MKNQSSLRFVSIILFFSLSNLWASSQAFEHLPEEEVDQEQITIARDFSHTFLVTLKEGKSYEFQDEAILELINSLTPDIQEEVYQDVQKKFGEYQDLEYRETWQQTGCKELVIIRFKGIFDDQKKESEIRIVLNSENKIAGFWIKPWIDDLR